GQTEIQRGPSSLIVDCGPQENKGYRNVEKLTKRNDHQQPMSYPAQKSVKELEELEEGLLHILDITRLNTSNASYSGPSQTSVNNETSIDTSTGSDNPKLLKNQYPNQRKELQNLITAFINFLRAGKELIENGLPKDSPHGQGASNHRFGYNRPSILEYIFGLPHRKPQTPNGSHLWFFRL
ncbi:hypothetical protein SK128_006647, partial [Halocaridina rubra]